MATEVSSVTPTELPTNSDDVDAGAAETSMTDEEVTSQQLASGRADLFIDLSLTRSSATTITAVIIVGANDRTLVNIPAVIAEIPDGIALITNDACIARETAEAQRFRCQVAPYMETTAGEKPIFSTPLVLEFEAGTDVAGQMVRFSAVSQDNPVSNDPDPTNNTAEIAIP